jgi:SAM-dependent methyltransferase
MRRLQFICPRCRKPVPIPDTPELPPCSSCGFRPAKMNGIISFLPETPVNEWQKFYDTKAAEKGNTTHGVGYRWPIQHSYIVKGFRRILGDNPPEVAILDVGCGNGLFWQALFDRHPAVGIDFSLPMCLLAQAKGMRVYQADATALPFAADQFDLVYSAEIAQCVPDLEAFTQELARVCRPGGRIVVSTLNGASLLRGALLLAWTIFHPDRIAKVQYPARRTAAGVAALAEARQISITEASLLDAFSPPVVSVHGHGAK